MWTLCHGKILTNQERHRRGMTTNPHYHHCPEEVESLDHIFHFSSMTRNLWPPIFDEKVWRLMKDMPFEGWFEWNIKKDLLGEKAVWKDKFASCMWWIGRWRNDSVIEKKMLSHEEKPSIIRSYIREVHSALSNHNVIHGRNDTYTTKWLRWFPPEHGWIKTEHQWVF